MIKHICVVGAGTMGHGIANVFAMAGCQVHLYEEFDTVRLRVLTQIQSELSFLAEEGYIQESQIEAALANITLFDNLDQAAANADFVVEAIPEVLALKKELFARLDAICPPHTIFASNTSSLPLGEMTADLSPERQARAMVCHWYNPAHLIPIVELSHFGNMEESVFQEVYALHVNAGKQPVTVLKDIPGLIANRMLHALAREVFHLIECGAATAEDIDKALKFGPGFRGATTGILETADMGGLDIWCAVEDNLFRALDNSAQASPLLRSKVSDGKLGIKSGEGFFSYSSETAAAASVDFNKRLLVQLKASKNYI